MFDFLSHNDRILLKTWSDYNNKTNIEYSLDIKQKLSLLLELIDSLHVDKVEMEEWLIWSEPMIFKFVLHSSSFLQLFHGTSLKVNELVITSFDEPTIFIMFRVIIENYLTFFYIFCDNISTEEKKFRMNVWKYSGLKQRSGFKATTEDSKLKLRNELVEIDNLKELINSSPFFISYKKEEQKQVLKGTKPRLFNTWVELNERSGFQTDLFKNLYGYKSNYTHSEFISILQIKSQNYGLNLNAKEHYTLLLLHSLVCKCILDLVEIFPSIKELYYKQNSDLIKEIGFLKKIAISSTPS